MPKSTSQGSASPLQLAAMKAALRASRKSTKNINGAIEEDEESAIDQ